MAMNCKPVPTLDERINDIRMRTAEIVNTDILPNESRLWAERREGESFHERTEILELRAEIKEKVKRPACGRRTCPPSTAAWASTSSRTRT
jgi:acyl-CoA dehydrogenase